MNKSITIKSFPQKKVKKINLPRIAAGDPWYDAKGITQQGQSDANLMGGIGNIASGVGGLLKNDDASSIGSYAGNILGDTGKYASIGAALGPWGAIGGAVVGAGIGTMTAITGDQAQQAEKRQTLANSNVANNTSISQGVNAKYNIRNTTNNRVPGLEKGTPMFRSGIANSNKPNAIIAPEEVVRDGQTGQLNQVPGQYNSSNPDTVPANLTQGSSVFSNQAKQILPGGKSTPADIMARAERVQKANQKALNPKEGEMKLDSLREKTIKLNLSNIQNQANNLNKFNVIANNTSTSNLYGQVPGFKNGTPSFEELNSLMKFTPNDAAYTIDDKPKTMGVPDMLNISGSTASKLIGGENVQLTKDNALNAPKNASTSVLDTSIGDKLSSLGNKIASLSPMAYNALNSQPEVVSPIYNNYINPNQRYNVSSELADAAKQRQISRYNNSVMGVGTGASQAFGADLYGRGVEQTDNLMGKAQMANNGYINDYANRYNQQSELASNENRRVYDLNARNRAASRNMGSKNIEMLSQFAQSQELMGNQKKNDKLNAYVYSLYNSAMRPEDRKKLNGMLGIAA
jgi:hypothetical protein